MTTTTRYIISRCTVEDSVELTHNNQSAFWADSNWRLAWTHRTLEYHISEMVKRMPYNLVKNATIIRHEKAVDPEANRIVGYCRWLLPESHSKNPDGTHVWPEAMGPAVSPEKEAELKQLSQSAVFDPQTESDAIMTPVNQVKEDILARKPLIRLDYLAVHPDNQGKGIGTALVQSGMGQAVKVGLDIFVYAFPAGVKMYKNLGFRIEKDFLLDDTTYGGEGNYYIALMVYKQKGSPG